MMNDTTDEDRADLERAKQMAADAKVLRRRVIDRLRQRAHRARKDQAG